MFKSTLAAGLVLSLSAVAATPVLPESWYVLPENSKLGLQGLAGPELNKKSKDLITPVVDTIFDASGQALDGINHVEEVLNTDPDKPKNWMPWHPELLMADLGVSASGLLGVLTMKGSPGVSVLWRRQNVDSSRLVTPLETQDVGSIQLNEDMPAREITQQLEPAIRAAVATGKIKDETALRKNLLGYAQEFQGVVLALQDQPDLGWWVSRLRLDVSVDASGSILGIGAVGAEVKFRFDWHRVQRKKPVLAGTRNNRVLPTTFNANLEKFVRAVSSDLESVSQSMLEKTGFRTYVFRVGIGVTAKGNIGIVKGSASTIGQIYFAQDTKKPVVKPRGFVAEDEEGTIDLIEGSADASHLRFAEENGIQYESAPSAKGGAIDQVVYKMDRGRFRKGLEKAAGMAAFFADRASKAPRRQWRIFELRASFDLSISGDLGFAAIGGLATAEMDLYNQNF